MHKIRIYAKIAKKIKVVLRGSVRYSLTWGGGGAEIFSPGENKFSSLKQSNLKISFVKSESVMLLVYILWRSMYIHNQFCIIVQENPGPGS